jgi:hypothetical protein
VSRETILELRIGLLENEVERLRLQLIVLINKGAGQGYQDFEASLRQASTRFTSLPSI